jgi:predicted nucleic acid-binding protein
LSRLCLDTSAYSHFVLGEPRVVQLVDSAEWIGMPAVAVGELQAGFLGGRRAERNADVLSEFLRDPLVAELPVDVQVARIYAEIMIALRRRGTPVPTNDVWIAATAARAGATLLAFDARFAAIERVGLVLLDPP